MYEIDFRIESLKRNKEKYNGKVIALYGIKDNAKRILEELADQNIVALIDKDVIGKTIFGKQTVSLDETLALGIEVIIIAAEMKSSVIVSKRILSFCKEHNITLLNMYGKEETNLHDAHKKQLCLEDENSVEFIWERIQNRETVFVQLTDALCEFVYGNEWELFAELEKENGLQAFSEGRVVAEKRCTQPIYSIKDIYDTYEAVIYPKVVNGKELYNLEEQLWIDSFTPNTGIVELINAAIKTGKRVYIVSDLKLSLNSINKLICKLGIFEEAIVLQENLCEKTFSNGALRPEAAEDSIEDALYIGTDKDYNSMLALSYGMELILVKGRSDKEEVLSSVEPVQFAECQNPQVSILIISDGDNDGTKACLKSILKNTINVEYEVIVLENGIEKLTDVRGDYVVFLRNNSLVQYNWLAPMVHLLKTDTTIGMVGSKIISPHGILLEAGGILWPDGSKESYGRGQNPDCSEYNYVKEVDYVSGVSVMLRTTLWKNINGLENCFRDLLDRETELAAEVRKREKTVVFQPASKVTYFGDCGASLGAEEPERKKRRFSARERKGNRKTVVFFSYGVPTPDCDAGSMSIFSYIMLFVRKGYIVKYVPASFLNKPRYSVLLEQKGIEVLYGDFYKKNIGSWLMENKEEIDFAFINYPGCGEIFMKMLKRTEIKVRYYGHDLHYVRKQREFELYKKNCDLEASRNYYAVEKELINAVDVVYYPSYVEEEIVKKEFGKHQVRAIPLYAYKETKSENNYRPENRKGIMFIGGYNHPPNVDAVLWFAKEVYPDISGEGQIPFYIVGSNEPPEVQLLDAPGIIHKGYVTDEELDALYEEIKLVIVPLRYGAGVKGKIIDTLYRGVPLVSTSIGVEGIQGAEQYIAIADDAEDFGKKVVELYYDDEKLLNASKGYGEIIKKYFSEEAAWNIIGQDF